MLQVKPVRCLAAGNTAVLFFIVFQTLRINWTLNTTILFVRFWRKNPQWARASSFTRFLDHTQRRTTLGRIPLDE